MSRIITVLALALIALGCGSNTDSVEPTLTDAGSAQESDSPSTPMSGWMPINHGSAPEARYKHAAVWTGSKMLVWGGFWYWNGQEHFLATGGSYDPAIDAWTPLSNAGAPSGRESPTAVWTGSKLLIWGGRTANGIAGDGASYDPATDAWTPLSLNGAPSPRRTHTAVWTGSKMIVWGGDSNDGASYDPATDAWTPLSTVGAPSPRGYHTAVWTGSKMVVWGGYASVGLADGGSYDPVSDTWTPISASGGAPSARYHHTATWIGDGMAVWGGWSEGVNFNDGSVLVNGLWIPMSLTDPPQARGDHTAVWTGTSLVVWGGSGNNGTASPALGDGGRYTP